ncbi:hypothetical protein ACFVFS_05820 [Kitasatospora sp. NPDC057692]|uniref:hypothetical protein n=1 Tax=Kitasatospora sp. NPDC057692 TaxID=3346215 RepID=UPI00367BFAFF
MGVEYSPVQRARATGGREWITSAGLPVRLPMDAEVPLTDRFMAEHGDDPQDWTAEVGLEYAAAVAELRARWLRGEVR